MLAKDLMRPWPYDIDEKAPLALAQQMMAWGGVRRLPVVRGGEVIGEITERQVLVRCAALGMADALREPVGDTMSPLGDYVRPGDSADEAIVLMAKENLDSLPVIDDGRLSGLLVASDVLRAALRAGLAESPTRSLTGGRQSVSAVMSFDPETIGGEEGLLTAARMMLTKGIRHLPVVDEDGVLIGILSDRDLREQIGSPFAALRDEGFGATRDSELTVADVMTQDVLTTTADASVTWVVDELIGAKVGAVPVVDKQRRVIGIVSTIDALAGLNRQAPPFPIADL